MKSMNYTGLWDYKLAWHSQRATWWVCFFGLVHGLRIHSFRPIRHCLIIKALANQVEFLLPLGCCTVINYAFTFCTTNVFSCFHCVVAHFKLVKHKFPNLQHSAHSPVQLSTHTWSEAMQKYVSIPTTMIRLTTVVTLNSKNCFFVTWITCC